MKLGIDFGTTRIVVAAADRGNYPLVSFEAPDGQAREWFPPLIAVSPPLATQNNAERLYGWDAWNMQSDPRFTVIRSIKRLLKQAGPNTGLTLGGETFLVQDLITELVLALRRHLRKGSTLQIDRGEPLEVMIGVPANANSNQRFLTAEAFRAAGFQVLGMLNEPSAASVEFGHRSMSGRKGGTEKPLLVYDLGGGTFDASLVEIEDNIHTVVATAGIPDVGGDDFDEILAEIALEAAAIPGATREALSPAQWFQLCEECRERKEALNANTRKIVVDFERVHPGWGEVSIAVGGFYERCRPLIERTEAVVDELLKSREGAADEQGLEALYVTGGGSELPAVARVLKENYGRRVRRSAYMRSATAIGLAISADDRSNYILKDRLARYFGVWREANHGENVAFDLLLPRGIDLPRPGVSPIRVTRAYQPVHNIGHFRYAESTGLGDDGQPEGNLTLWDDIRFPFDPALRDGADLSLLPVTRNLAGAQLVEEEYTCDAGGMVKVTITNRSAGYRREYALGRWSAKAPRVAAAAAAPAKRDWSQRHRETR